MMRTCSAFRNPHSAFDRFLLAILPSVRTVGGHEACQAILRRRIFTGLLRRDRRGTGPASGRANGQSNPQRFHQHSNSGRTFRGPGKTGQAELGRPNAIADGFIAVEAKDSQQVKNIGTDIIKLAKALGVSENVLSRGNSINEFAENDEWDALQEELEATQNEVKSSMQSHRDQDLIILVSVGGWIRGTQVVSAAVMQNYDERAAKVLRQPALVNFIQSKLNEVSPEVRDEPLVKEVSGELPGIEKLVTFPVGKAPTADEVRKVNEAVGKIMSKIQSKEAK